MNLTMPVRSQPSSGLSGKFTHHGVARDSFLKGLGLVASDPDSTRRGL